MTLDCVIENDALLAIIPDPVVCFKNAIFSQTQVTCFLKTFNAF